jgi:putative peptidoglycan lipid II flippase
MVVLGTHFRQGEAALESMHPSNERDSDKVRSVKTRLTDAAWSISAAIMISRILGLGREMVLARYFGAGLATDAFNVAYRIPNLLRDLFAEGALSAAFIPTFVRRLKLDGKQEAWILANRVISALLVILGALTLAFFFGAKGFVYLLAAGYASIPEKFELTVQLTRIMAPFLLCVSLASVGMGILNAFGSFFLPAMASSAFNASCILAGIFLSPLMPRLGLQPIISMAIGALVGGASQFIVMMPKAHSFGFRFRFSLDLNDPDLRYIANLMLPAIVGLSATQINIAVDTQIASTFGNGPVSWLNYGFRLIHLPVGIFGIAIATATMTAVSQYAAQKSTDKLHRTVASSLKLAACLTFPATVGLMLFRYEIVQLLFQRGSFLPADTMKTAQVVLFYSIGLFSFSAVKIMVPAFYALDNTRTPVRVSLIAVAVKVALNFLFIVPFGFLGLALATAVGSWANCALLWRKLSHLGKELWKWEDLSVYARIASASIAMGVFSRLVYSGSGWVLSGSGTLVLAVRLGLAILLSLLSLLPLYRLFRVEEGKELFNLIDRWKRRVR